jgi:hypothetical protein
MVGRRARDASGAAAPDKLSPDHVLKLFLPARVAMTSAPQRSPPCWIRRSITRVELVAELLDELKAAATSSAPHRGQLMLPGKLT